MANEEKDYGKSNMREDQKEEDARSTQNNAQNIRNAADVAMATKNPYAMAAGAAVKAADKITGGKSTEALGKGLTKANKMVPGGRSLQKASNKVNESGAGDKIGQAARMKSGGKGGAAGGAAAASNASNAANAAEKANNVNKAADKAQQAKSAAGEKSKRESSGGGRSSSLPSSSDSSDGKKSKGAGSFFARVPLIASLVIFFGPILLLLLLFTAVMASAAGIFGEYDDALGMSQTLGEETGGIEYVASSQEQQDYFDRINNVKLSYQAEGKSIDAMKIAAIFHVLKSNNADIEYENVSESTISSWADAMLLDGVYDEETFKNNLINSIFPSYLPNSSKTQRKEMAEEVFSYIEDYNDFIDNKEENTSSCGSIGSCTYDIKGFYANGSNISKNMSISDLKVRLMQCGGEYGNGSYTTPIKQDLVDFEKYVAGVAYAEVGDGNPIEQYKAQMVAARSFALSRPAAMGNARGLKLAKENGQWILQISSCVADQVYCDIDKGCHGTGGSQGGYVVSGDDPSAWFHKPALPEDNDIRKAAEATQGEVLVNKQGYIINAGFLSTEQNLWHSLAKQGLNYKQILMKTYGKGGTRNYGATDIKKTNCNGSGGICASSGEYSNWRQGDAQWGNIEMGGSGSTISQIGCLVTSVAIQIARSGVEVSINPFNPGTFVQFLNKNGGFVSGGNFVWASPQKAAPKFVYQDKVYVSGMSRQQKLNKIKELTSQNNVYVVAEVKGNTGQHWVAIEGVNGSTVKMNDPASDSQDMWQTYNWANTSTLAYYKVG